MKLLKYENAKLSHQLIFNLPATPQICGRVCPGCYAAKAQVRFKAVLLSRERNYLASQLPSFPSRVIAEILDLDIDFSAITDKSLQVRTEIARTKAEIARTKAQQTEVLSADKIIL